MCLLLKHNSRASRPIFTGKMKVNFPEIDGKKGMGNPFWHRT
jgi:hypothetical protein